MDDFSASGLLYLVATAFFILGIKRLSKVKTARSGNQLSAIGMLIAVVVTLVSPEGGVNLDMKTILIGIAIGGGVGAIMAKRVEMTGMPELVALLNGFGGLASTMVAFTDFYGLDGDGSKTALGAGVWSIAIILSIFIGTVTFTGSLMAMGKLSGKISGNPVVLPARHLVTALLIVGGLGCAGYGLFTDSLDATTAIYILLACSATFGVVSVLPIGGAD
ncbi:MAG: NAD(P)(+) transhydrogenase (Re/Si-specific) subunit beta, partial [Planctomycetota bacterium]|nr:NAD(P)(+) transhydrogenase (Re/Si-specific) subunit beta [Planctomycetota bacterium]